MIINIYFLFFKSEHTNLNGVLLHMYRIWLRLVPKNDQNFPKFVKGRQDNCDFLFPKTSKKFYNFFQKSNWRFFFLIITESYIKENNKKIRISIYSKLEGIIFCIKFLLTKIFKNQDSSKFIEGTRQKGTRQPQIR